MTKLGWLFLLLSWGILSYFTYWCFKKIFGAPVEE